MLTCQLSISKYNLEFSSNKIQIIKVILSMVQVKICGQIKIMECRTCLEVTEELQELFTEDCDLPHKIETFSKIQILEDDRFPSKICYSCVKNVRLLYDFVGIVRRSCLILENRAYSAKNEEIDESGNDTELLETDLIQIDEIKLESETESPDVDESVKIDEKEKLTNDGADQVAIRKRNRRRAAPNTIYKCSQCDFTTPEYNLYRSHRRRHKDKHELRSICNFCGKWITRNNFSTHLSKHTDAPVTCNICGLVFKHNVSLSDHMHTHKNLSLQCTYCGKIFNKRHSYYKHIREHKNGDLKTVKCPMCEKLFANNYLVTRHLRTHTGERPYLCEYCKKGFSSSNALKTHVRQHTNEKPFACDFCDMAFPQRVSLRTHMKSKHPGKTSKQQSG